MKKLLLSLALVFVLATNAFSAGVWTQNLLWLTTPEQKTATAVVTFTWTTTSAGLVTAALSPFIKDSLKGSYLHTVVTKPDTVLVPSAYYVSLVDEYGADILGGVGASRSTTESQQVTPLIGAAYAPRPISGTFTFTVQSGGDTRSGTTVLYFTRDK